MGGVFINYRRGAHGSVVTEVYERLARHFGAQQVFLDTSSIVPGRRFPDELRARIEDCEVVLVVIHEGWAAERDASGARRLDEEKDWVRQEIELALRAGKIIVPLLLDGVKAPRSAELPAAIREVMSWEAHRLPGDRRQSALTELVAVLESHVARTWEPIEPHEKPPFTPGRWLGVSTAVLAAAVLVGVPVLGWDESAARTGRVPFAFFAAAGSLLAMCAPLVAVAVMCGLFRRPVDSWERELHAVEQRKYLSVTHPIAVTLVLVALFGALALTDHGPAAALGLLLVVAVSVARSASTFLRAERKDIDEVVNWPQRLPAAVTRPLLRRAVARLAQRAAEWSGPLPREQREKAWWVLKDVARVLETVDGETRRTRREWLAQDHPWLFSCYVIWVTLSTALALAAILPFVTAGRAPWGLCVMMVVIPLVGLALALGTMEGAYRQQRWQRRTLSAEVARRTAELGARVTELSSPARTRPVTPE